MINQRWFLVLFLLLLLPLPLYASFIEATIGTAVVNDATATYYNPAALSLVNNPQMIGLGSLAYFRTHFTGQTIQRGTGFIQSGTSTSKTHYYLPSLYSATPLTNKFFAGLAVIANDFNRDIEGNSILRYVQSNNHVQDVDFVPALGVKLNHFLALGVGLNVSHAEFLLEPLSGFPSLNIPDSQSRNNSSATSVGEDAGILLTPSSTTLIGFNYRSALTYHLTGSSTLLGTPSITANNYHFTFWTPARSTFTISQLMTKRLGFIGTIQYIEWKIFKTLNIYNIATLTGRGPIIVPQATVLYHFRNTWLLTLGTQYRVTPAWVIRIAGTYSQSPSNGHYQIANGDSFILGASMGYNINKNIVIDGSYAHAFMEPADINITTGRNSVNGTNKGFRDAVSLKLTINM